jgi:hypothetical protein
MKIGGGSLRSSVDSLGNKERAKGASWLVLNYYTTVRKDEII